VVLNQDESQHSAPAGPNPITKLTTDINEPAEVEEEEESASDETPSPVVGVSPSGAKIY